MLISALRRSRKLHNVLGCTSIKPSRQQYSLYEIRINLYSNNLYLTNGFAFQSLSIAGTNTLSQHMSNPHYIQQRSKSYHYQHTRIPRKKPPHNPSFNNKMTHGTEYDTDPNKTLKDIFTVPSLIDNHSIEPKKKNKKSFHFEYMEYLKQKHRTNPNRKLQHNSKRKFCSERIPEPGANPRLHAARLTAQQQQIMAKEDEINPTSLGGLMVIAIGAAIFYWLYNIDNTKHSGISSFLSRFSKTKTIEYFIESQESKPIHRIPDDWAWFRVCVDHVKNVCLCWFDASKYNSEWIWSKLFRLFYIPSAKLLPPTKQTMFTLVLDLDTVCHSTWSRKEGFERTMRPYYKEFISRMFASGWEVVIFGQCEDYDWIESPDFVKLDGKGYVQNYLWNKDCYYFNGHRCKDLSRLGRDMRHVIAIDSDPRSLQLQPENALVLKRWKPSMDKGKDGSNKANDTSLLQLIEFLEYLAKAEVADVRQVLAAYRGKDIAQEFRKRYFAAVQAQLQQEEYEEEEEVEQGPMDIEEEGEGRQEYQYAV